MCKLAWLVISIYCKFHRSTGASGHAGIYWDLPEMFTRTILIKVEGKVTLSQVTTVNEVISQQKCIGWHTPLWSDQSVPYYPRDTVWHQTVTNRYNDSRTLSLSMVNRSITEHNYVTTNTPVISFKREWPGSVSDYNEIEIKWYLKFRYRRINQAFNYALRLYIRYMPLLSNSIV